ncbi:hypothetical protein H6F42_08165 [Pseudanabaena sp. FACHB-1998]|uniref:hypothetical protein n=1 Tax=Pseudanabaena sp. FACHB-1998 TaxID=2692858 RepID=UPI00168019C7|nr:hypothetical protein [Pseudanabaena sp. FACHB-1998]MBD2176884.1 hypothetical protein [Pseudanabaena sp. FACHB-1998]
MDSNSGSIKGLLEQKIVECYSSQGYEVIHHPDLHQLPFDFNSYASEYYPDLLVKTSEHEGFIIEIRDTAADLAIAQYRLLAQTVAAHSGWRFLLITGEDATPIAEEDIADPKLTRSQILNRKERIAKLISIGEHEAAFLSLWIFAEVLMRRHARQTFLPIDRLPTIAIIEHLHAQSEMSESQFERAIALNEVRNRVAHGFPVKSINLNEALEKLLNLVDEFIATEKI